MAYSTIVVDPPWAYEGFASDPTSGRALAAHQRRPVAVVDLPYPSLTEQELAALPVSELAAKNGCRLFMWTTNRHLPSALAIVRTWGFRYTQLLTWHKTGNPSPFGGSVAPNHAEFLVVAVRGAVPVLRRLPSSVISVAAQRRHSQKPEHFLDLIEQVSPGPYVELFARRHRLGWDVWGDQSANTAQLAG